MFVFSAFYERLRHKQELGVAIHTGDVHSFRSSDRHSAAGASVFPRAGRLAAVGGKMNLPPHGKENFARHGKQFFTQHGKEFFTWRGKEFFTS